MNAIDSAKENLRNAFDKVLGKKYIYKVDVLQLKRLAKTLVDADDAYKPLLSRITTQLNSIEKGALSQEKREKLSLIYSKNL
jgi:hypothetical protein